MGYRRYAAWFCLCELMVMSRPVQARRVEITDFMLDRGRVRVGERFVASVEASGRPDFAVRYNGEPGRLPPGGWVAHGPGYRFLKSDDYGADSPHKDSGIWHKDNGRHDLDARRGIFTIRIDTTGWPPGEYDFLFMAANPTEQGAATKPFRVCVVAGDMPGSPLVQGVEIEVNGRRLTREEPAAPCRRPSPVSWQRTTVYLTQSVSPRASFANESIIVTN